MYRASRDVYRAIGMFVELYGIVVATNLSIPLGLFSAAMNGCVILIQG